jgi:L-lactate utilization protein LutC
VAVDTGLVGIFGERLADGGGRLHEAPSLAAARELARALAGEATVARWDDPELDGIAALEAPAGEASLSLVLASFGVAETGAIGLVHGPGRPRGAGVLPERQVALLALPDLLPNLAGALTRLYRGGGPPPASVVLVAGPSHTADIEQRSIIGVHAPRELDVILYGVA